MSSWGEGYDLQLKSTQLINHINFTSQDIFGHVLTFKSEGISKAPTKAEVEAKAKSATKADIVKYLKDLKSLLADPNEYIEPDQRAKLQHLYKEVSDHISSGSVEVEEFFNHNHGRGGLFTSGPGGGSELTKEDEKSSGVAKAEEGPKEKEKESKGKESKGKAKEEGSIVSRLGNIRDPLNKYDATVKEATEKAAKATLSAGKWAAVAVIAAYGGAAVGSAVLLGITAGAIAVSTLRVFQAVKHNEQARLLARQALGYAVSQV